jgi:myosin heavy chain 9/10/11/14
MEFKKNDKNAVDTNYILNRTKTIDSTISKSFTDKKWVWVPDSTKCFVSGYIVSESNGMVHVNVNNEVKILKENEIMKMNPPKFDLVEDLAALGHLNEPSVLHNLSSRYQNGFIYTYSGLFLLAVNPYRDLNIYSEKFIRKYTMNKKYELEPHIYGVANEAYNNMLNNKENQSILITGESGAGKTENTKKVIEFLASIAGYGKKAFKGEASGQNSNLGIKGNQKTTSIFNSAIENHMNSNLDQFSTIDKQILMTNPILEAFGNAKTVKNDNSSRFGKFIQIKFNGGNICGAHIEKYLLEKSRITFQNSDERNYHIFYQLLKCDDEKLLNMLFLDKDIKSYRFLQGITKIEGVDDHSDFIQLRRSFKDLHFSNDVELFYYKIVAAVLHLGNLKIIERNNGTEIENFGVVDKICKLLEIPSSHFINSLLHPVIKAGNEYITQSRSAEQVYSIIDALAKILYDKMFDQIINELNNKLGTTISTNFIGVLDIAGFEIFKENGFEQLCINYTNEKLQQFFNHHMFILEQEIYKKENIEWNFIDFGLDLQPTIDLIEKNNPIGILSYLDEECVMPKASDKTFLDKLKSIKNQKFKNVYFKEGFILEHYAGEVEYLVNNWITKNKDPNFENINELINKSGNTNVSELSFIDKNIKRGFFRTVGQKHKEQLNSLMKTLSQTNPHFVRCIIPNLKKSGNFLDNKIILQQLKCNGVLEGIRISRQGYPSRMTYDEFVDRYKVLNNDGCMDYLSNLDKREESCEILRTLKLSESQFKLGLTKIFFRQSVLADIEDLREIRISEIMKEVQAVVRSKLEKLKFNLEEHRKKAICIIKKNAKICVDLQKWNWWKLYLKIKPLLDVRKRDNELKEKDNIINQYMKVIEDFKIKNEGLTKINNEIYQKNESLLRDLEMEKIHIIENDELIKGIRNQSKEIEKEKRELEKIIKSLNEAHAQEKANYDILFQKEIDNKNALEEKLRVVENEKLQSVNDEIKYLKKTIADLKEVNKKIINEHEVLNKENEILNEKLKDAGKSKETLQQQLNEKESILGQVNLNLKIYQDNLKKIKEENNDMIFENEKLEKRVFNLESEIEKKNEELMYASENCKKFESDYDVLKIDYDSILKKNKDLQLQISELEQASISSNIEKVDKSNLLLEKKIKKLTDKIKVLENINSNLIQDKEEIRQQHSLLVQTKMDEFFEGERQFNAVKKALKLENQKLANENLLLKKELDDLKAASESSEDSALEKLYRMLDKEKKFRREIEQKIMDYENRNLNLQNTINELTKCSCSLNDVCLCKCSNCNVSCRSSYKNLNNFDSDEIDEIIDSVNLLVDGFNNTFYNILDSNKKRIEFLICKVNELECALLEKKTENNNLSKNMSDIKNQCADLKEVNSENLKKIQTLNTTNESYLFKISQLELSLDDKSNLLESIKSKYNDIQSSFKRMNLDNKKEIENSISNIKRLNSMYDSKINEITESKNAEISMLKSKVNDLELKITMLENNKYELESLKIENSELKKMKDSEILIEPMPIGDSTGNYLTKIHDLERKKSILEKEVKNIKGSIKDYQGHFEAFLKENGELKKEIERKNKEIFDLIRQKNIKSLQIEQMERDLIDGREMIDFLKNVSLNRKSKKVGLKK